MTERSQAAAAQAAYPVDSHHGGHHGRHHGGRRRSVLSHLFD